MDATIRARTIYYFLVIGGVHFTFVPQLLLPKPMYDHSPILIDCRGLKKGKMPFRFKNMLKTEGLGELFSTSFVIEKKLQGLKIGFKKNVTERFLAMCQFTKRLLWRKKIWITNLSRKRQLITP